MCRLCSSVAGALIVTVTAGSALAQQQPAPPSAPAAPPHVVCSKTFQQADTNKDGVLTRDDLAPAERKDDFIGKSDTNSDGIVTVAEFNAGCSKNLFHRAEKH